jgi:hypothetical protein
VAPQIPLHLLALLFGLLRLGLGGDLLLLGLIGRALVGRQRKAVANLLDAFHRGDAGQLSLHVDGLGH